MIGFVESHGKVLTNGYRPSLDLFCHAVNDGNLLQIGNIHVYIWPGFFELKRFRLAADCVHLIQPFVGHGIHGGNG